MPFIPEDAPLETPRLRLRRATPADLLALMAVNGDERVTCHLPCASWKTLDDAQAWFERMRLLQAGGGALQFVLLRREDELPVGTALLFRADEGSRRAEIGYVLAREHWGRGLMHEALQALLQWAFGTVRLHRVEAEVNPANEASWRLLERLGFQREGLLRQRWWGADGPHDVAAYGLLAPDFEKTRTPPR